MGLTAEQLEQRRTRIGASDAPAILGCATHPPRSKADVYFEKVHPAEPEPTEIGSPADLGTRFEPVLIGLLEDSGFKVERPAAAIDDGLFSTYLDGWIASTAEVGTGGAIVEAKSTGQPGWGDPERPNDVPDAVLAQVAVKFHLVREVQGINCRLALVPVIFGRFGFGWSLYRVERNDELVAAVIDECRQFWERHVLARVAPIALPPALETVRRIIRRDDGEAVPVSAHAARRARRLREAKVVVENESRAADAALIAELGDARFGEAEGFGVEYREIAGGARRLFITEERKAKR